jgi:hypothetical protein
MIRDEYKTLNQGLDMHRCILALVPVRKFSSDADESGPADRVVRPSTG